MMNEFDLHKLKEQAKLASDEDGHLIETRLVTEDLTYLAAFLNGIAGFMMGKKNKANKFNFMIRGPQREVDALKAALLSNKTLMKKIERGNISRGEMDRLLRQARMSKRRFEELTGITLPF